MSTEFFFALTPDRVLAAVESAGMTCTGRCAALNSFENRVYDVELEDAEGLKIRRVIKFYRPGRWSKEQILEEHAFLNDLKEAEIPVIAPIPFSDGTTLRQESGIWFALFPRVGGRAPDELSVDQLLRIGRLLGRIHNVGAQRAAPNRLEISPETYGRKNLEFLLSGNWIPLEYAKKYERAATEICDLADGLFKELPAAKKHRLHGDCHLGNLLWDPVSGPFFLDFDDMVRGPAVQDIWLLIPGRDPESVQNRAMLLEGYGEMRAFDQGSLNLLEPLRALRFIHYTAWVARRWEDPAFPLAFPQFGTSRYWADETNDLEEQLRLIRGGVSSAPL